MRLSSKTKAARPPPSFTIDQAEMLGWGVGGGGWPVTPEQSCDFNTRSPQSHYKAPGRGAQGSDLIQTHTDKCKWDSAVCLHTHYTHALPGKQSGDQPPLSTHTHTQRLPRASLHEEQTHTSHQSSTFYPHAPVRVRRRRFVSDINLGRSVPPPPQQQLHSGVFVLLFFTQTHIF